MNTDIQNRQVTDEIRQFIWPDGKRILEIGCGNGALVKYIAGHYAPDCIIGIDPGLDSWWHTSENAGSNWRVESGDAEALDFEDNSFDAVISVSTFEHINDTAKALSEIKRVLKPYGRFYTSFMPIWTSIIGHHFVAPEDNTWNENHLALIPPWGHLYMDKAQMNAHLEECNTKEELKNQILQFIYHSEIVNRKSRQDLLHDIMGSGMAVRSYREMLRFSRIASNTQSELTADIVEKLIAAGHKVSEVGVIGMKFCLEKFAAC